ncbi:hypothetical protein ACWJJH_19765 [Endozoicomonadaceae bacterium StTr2]
MLSKAIEKPGTMFTHLQQHYSRPLGTTLLVLMLLSMLQFCLMPIVNAQPSGLQPELPVSVTSEESVLAHGCCLPDNLAQVTAKAETLCPECESADGLPQTFLPDHPEPLFALLYITAQQTLDPVHTIRHWQTDSEPIILASRPDIYLANATFLE